MQRIGRISVSLPREWRAALLCMLPSSRNQQSAVASRFSLACGTMYVEHFNSFVSQCFEAIVSGLDVRGTFCVEHFFRTRKTRTTRRWSLPSWSEPRRDEYHTLQGAPTRPRMAEPFRSTCGCAGTKKPAITRGLLLKLAISNPPFPLNDRAIYTSIIAGVSRISLRACRYCAPTAPSMVR